MFHPPTASRAALSPLIQATAPDGARFVFAILPNEHQCCVLRNGDTIFTAAADEPGIDAAVEMMMRACAAESFPATGGDPMSN